jgi:hypothetical protein
MGTLALARWNPGPAPERGILVLERTELPRSLTPIARISFSDVASLTPRVPADAGGWRSTLDLLEGGRRLLFAELRLRHGLSSCADRPKPLSCSSFDCPRCRGRRQEQSRRAVRLPKGAEMAERVGFEPTVEFPLHTLSKRAPSTTRTSLRVFRISSLRLVAEPANPNCDTDCDRPPNVPRSLTGIRLGRRPKPPETTVRLRTSSIERSGGFRFL